MNINDLASQAVLCPIMVGRDQPAQALLRLFDLSSVGQGRIGLVSGEAGIGKSRLVREFKAQLQPFAPLIMQGTCFETDQSLPYAPISELLRTHFRMHPSERSKSIFTRDTTELIRLLPELASEFPDLRRTTDDNELENRQLQQALAQLFVSLSDARPLLIVIEDLHWCDDASLEFLQFFARRLSGQHIMLVMTYRDDDISPQLAQLLAQLIRERLAVEIHLQRLMTEAVGGMIRTIFTAELTSSEKFIDAVHNLSEGNPFFIEELLKSLVAAGDLYLSDGEWKLKPLFELHVPRTIQVNLNQRFNRLSPTAREILTLAAVAGRRFDFTLIQHLASLTEIALIRIMRELRDAQFVTEESAEQFSFRHSLTQQTIYNELLLRERRNLHRIIGEALEKLHLQDPSHVGDIANHYFQAEMWEKSISFSQQAAEWAQKLYSPRAAIEHFTRALEAVAHLGRIPAPEILRTRGQMYERTGNFEAARDDYTRIIAIAHDNNDALTEWQGWLDLGWLWTERDFAQAGGYFFRALELARHMEATPLLAQTLNRVGNWHLHADQLDQGLQYHQQALSICQQLNDVRGQAESLDLLGLTSYYLGNMVVGTEYYDQCIALFKQMGDFAGLSGSLSVMSMRGASYNLDTFAAPVVSQEQTVAEGDEAVEAARKIGWRAGEASALLYCGFGRGPRGDFDSALTATHLGLSIATEIEHGQWQGAAHLVLGAIYRDMLALQEARHHHETVHSIVKELHAPFLFKMVSGHLASTYIACNEFELAEGVLQQVNLSSLPMLSIGQRLVWCAKAELLLATEQPASALEIIERMIATANTASVSVPKLEYLKGEALRQLGRKSEAAAILLTAEQIAQQQGVPPLCWRILISLGKCYQEQGRHEQADEAFFGAQEIAGQLANHISDDRLHENFETRANEHINLVHRPSPRRAAKRAFDGLTTREREIAVLIAQGKSNRVIAEILTLSERTVAKHVENVLSKLNFTSRSQVAVWAVDKGLHKPNQ